MEKMEKTEMAKRYLGYALNIATGAGLVIGAAYLLSRIKEKQETETRLERMEQILEKLSEEKEEKSKESEEKGKEWIT